jgi:hypothetical protein
MGFWNIAPQLRSLTPPRDKRHALMVTNALQHEKRRRTS